MRINLDLPKYKWDDIYNHLSKHIDESENVAALCTAIKMNHYEKSLKVCKEISKKKGWKIIQDVAWRNY